MGQTLLTDKEKVTIEIKVFDPDRPNFNTYSDYTNPELDHIDLIAGQVSGLISPDNPDYHKDNVSTTHVIARFDGAGNPQPDIAEESSPAKAFSDLWFYSNPVFVEFESTHI